MKIRKNGTVVNLTESDLRKIVKRVLNESSGDLEKQFCKNGSFNYDKYYSTRCKVRYGSDSFEGCKDNKEYVNNLKVDGITWNQNGFGASRVDWVEGPNREQYICPNDRGIMGIENK